MIALAAPQTPTIAVVGASRDPEKWGQRVIRYTRSAGFAAKIYAINPRASRADIPSATVAADLDDIEDHVDIAFIALPREQAAAAVSHCASRGIETIVVAASGFGEQSDAGAAAEADMLESARDSGSRIIGPNCFGLYVGRHGVNLTPFGYLQAGDIALASQSGNIAGEIALEMNQYGLGFSYCVGVGNQLDVGFPDLARLFASDEGTRAVAFYVEGLQQAAGADFASGIRECRAAGKPVVVIKGGASALGAAAAATHTRSLASNDRVWAAVLADAGALRVGTVPELVDVLRCARARLPRGRRVGIVTDGGGDTALALDELARSSLRLARYSSSTVDTLERIMPPLAPRSPGANPATLDTAGGVEDDPLILSRVCDAIAADPGVDAIALSGLFGSYIASREKENEAAHELVRIAETSRRTVVAHGPLPVSQSEPLAILERGGIPVFDSMGRALHAVDLLSRLVGPTAGDADQTVGEATSNGEATLRNATQWPLDRAAEWLRNRDVAVPTCAVVNDRGQLGALEPTLKFPVCVKVADPGIVHKSDAGGVLLGLTTFAMVCDAAERLWSRHQQSSLLVMPQFDAGFELLLGGYSDPIFGPVVIVGKGGVTAEVEKDTVLVSGEVTSERVLAALCGLRCYPSLAGYRGSRRLATDRVAKLAAAIGSALRVAPALSIDLNPVIVSETACSIADWRIVGPLDAALADAV